MGILREEELRTLGVYIHIPFCVSKCPYCDFKSVVTERAPEARYAVCLARELSSVLSKEGIEKEGRTLESIYLGGGTPSLFSPETISSIIRSVKSELRPADDAEVTMEVNPDTVTFEKLNGYRSGGVNRLSIGLQSLDDECLRYLGRTHSAGKGLQAYKDARRAGFENIGVDLMFGSPHQKLSVWLDTVKRAIELRPEHISMYGLTIEESTPFYVLFHDEHDRQDLPSEDTEIEMYRRAVELFREAGYGHYEISNLALPGFESVHNSRYWLGKDYLGLGSSAHSYLYYPGWGRRWWNDPSPYVYMDGVERSGLSIAGDEELSRSEALTEALVLGLRMLKKGVSGADFKKRFGVYPKEALAGLDELKERGLIEVKGEDILLTFEGALVSNEVFLKISA